MTILCRIDRYIHYLFAFGTLPVRLCDESKHCPVCGFDHEYRAFLNAHRYCKNGMDRTKGGT